MHERVQIRIEKVKDQINKTENKILVVFHLENITLLKADVGSLFYQRKQ